MRITYFDFEGIEFAVGYE